MDDQYVTAFYNTEGELVALTRSITVYQLPIVLQTSLKKEHQNYWISDLFEVANDQGNTYYVTIENADTKIVLKSNSTYGWSTYKKFQKS